MDIEIRLATLDDLAEIQSMNNDLFQVDAERDPDMNFDWPHSDVGEAYFRRRIETIGVCFVATLGESLVGYLAGSLRTGEEWRTKNRSEVENMFVKTEHRRSGAGRLLMSRFFDWSREQGAQQVMVEAFAGNDNAIAFYESNGFRTHAITLQTNL